MTTTSKQRETAGARLPTLRQMRRRLNRLRYTVGRYPHEVFWQVAGDRMIDRYIRRRSRLEKHYWLFVCGVNNSGTTLIHEMLRHHREVRVLPKEGHRLTPGLPTPGDYNVGRLWSSRPDVFRWEADHDAGPVRRIKYDWLYYCERRAGIILEKSPPNAIRSLWLQRHFTPARFVVVVRDPYAVSEGVRRRKGWSIEQAATHWAQTHECLVRDMPGLEKVMRLKYEDLCEHPERELCRLEDFLELSDPIDRSLVSQPMRARNLTGVRSALRNFNPESIARLSGDDIDVITRIAGPVMGEFGYVRP